MKKHYLVVVEKLDRRDGCCYTEHYFEQKFYKLERAKKCYDKIDISKYQYAMCLADERKYYFQKDIFEVDEKGWFDTIECESDDTIYGDYNYRADDDEEEE